MPYTTNQTYGHGVKQELLQQGTGDFNKKDGRFYNDNKNRSNLGFFPQISGTKPLTHQRSKTAPAYNRMHHVVESSVSGSSSLQDMRHYSMGHVPVASRVIRHQYPIDAKLVMNQTVPSTYKPRKPTHHDLYLWHTLSGCLVHVKTPVPKAKAGADGHRFEPLHMLCRSNSQ